MFALIQIAGRMEDSMNVQDIKVLKTDEKPDDLLSEVGIVWNNEHNSYEQNFVIEVPADNDIKDFAVYGIDFKGDSGGGSYIKEVSSLVLMTDDQEEAEAKEEEMAQAEIGMAFVTIFSHENLTLTDPLVIRTAPLRELYH